MTWRPVTLLSDRWKPSSGRRSEPPPGIFSLAAGYDTKRRNYGNRHVGNKPGVPRTYVAPTIMFRWPHPSDNVRNLEIVLSYNTKLRPLSLRRGLELILKSMTAHVIPFGAIDGKVRVSYGREHRRVHSPSRFGSVRFGSVRFSPVRFSVTVGFGSIRLVAPTEKLATNINKHSL